MVSSGLVVGVGALGGLGYIQTILWFDSEMCLVEDGGARAQHMSNHTMVWSNHAMVWSKHAMVWSNYAMVWSMAWSNYAMLGQTKQWFGH